MEKVVKRVAVVGSFGVEFAARTRQDTAREADHRRGGEPSWRLEKVPHARRQPSVFISAFSTVSSSPFAQ